MGIFGIAQRLIFLFFFFRWSFSSRKLMISVHPKQWEVRIPETDTSGQAYRHSPTLSGKAFPSAFGKSIAKKKSHPFS